MGTPPYKRLSDHRFRSTSIKVITVTSRLLQQVATTLIMSRMLVACILGMISMLVPASARSPFEVRLISDVADVGVEFGLVVNHANTIEREPTLVPPPGNYSRGSMIVAAFRSLDPKLPGTYEVYVTNSTGNIPLTHEHKRAAEGDALAAEECACTAGSQPISAHTKGVPARCG